MRPNRPIPSTPIGQVSDKGKAPLIQKSSNLNVQCFKCSKKGHYSNQYPTHSLHIGEIVEEENEPIKEIEEEVYEAESNLINEYVEEEEEIDYEENLGVVRILTQIKEKEDWRRTNILQMFIKTGEKVYKIIIDNGSYVNAISTKALKTLGLTLVSHPNPYKVS